jgi:predicted Fe-S protein YdhL (DUF1289 family)
VIAVHIPGLRIESIANTRRGHHSLARVKKQQRQIVAWSLVDQQRPTLPVVVTIARIGVRDLDDDNLAHACKAIRDEIAAWLGCDDGPRAPVTWRYEQRRGAAREYGCTITIAAKESADA